MDLETEVGTFHFEFGVKPALMIPGRVAYSAIYIDGTQVRNAIVTFKDKDKYFKPIHSTEFATHKVLAHLRYLLKKSPITGHKREMTKKTKKLLKSTIERLKK